MSLRDQILTELRAAQAQVVRLSRMLAIMDEDGQSTPAYSTKDGTAKDTPDLKMYKARHQTVEARLRIGADEGSMG